MEAKDDKTLWKDLLEHTKESAPEGFTDRVMAMIEQEAVTVSPPKPLISRRSWILIGIWALALLTGGFYTWSEQDLSGLGIARSFIARLDWSLEGIAVLPELPATFAWCGLALLLFAGLHMRWMYGFMIRRLA